MVTLPVYALVLCLLMVIGIVGTLAYLGGLFVERIRWNALIEKGLLPRPMYRR